MLNFDWGEQPSITTGNSVFPRGLRQKEETGGGGSRALRPNFAARRVLREEEPLATSELPKLGQEVTRFL